MGKPAKKRSPARATPTVSPPARKPAPASAAANPLLRSPTLALAWLSLVITLFSVGVAVWFRDDLEMGAIREPTSSIIWAALTATLFARHWRERQGAAERKPDS